MGHFCDFTGRTKRDANEDAIDPQVIAGPHAFRDSHAAIHLQTGARIMRYELTDHEWAAIKPMLPNKPRGIPRVNDRRVLNGIFWVLRSGAPWRDLPQEFGPYTTCYNRFVRWRRARVWSRMMDAGCSS